MTVMLLQRSNTPQLIRNQKIVDNNKANEPPFLILLDIQEDAELNHSTSGYDTSSNNNINCNIDREKRNHQNIAVIGHNSTCGPGSLYVADGSCSKLDRNRGGSAPGGIAMRYYRLWIYACNIVILVSAIGFAAAVSRTLLFPGDLRRYLVPGLPKAYDPTALYAYFSLTVQFGLVQLLGCIAAKRLSTKLLNAYWFLLLGLLFGDIVIGIAWVFRYERMKTELRPSLRLRLQVEYNKERQFSEQWDQLQHEFSCCGVEGPLDFGSQWPQSCCLEPSTNINFSSENDFNYSSKSTNNSSNQTSIEICIKPYSKGCDDCLINWLRKTAHLLFVIGFCVIAFTKLCFLGILRYEIREMIQKIHLLKETSHSPASCTQPFATAQSTLQLQQRQQHLMEVSVNNDNINKKNSLPAVSTTATPGPESLLIQADDYTNSKLPLLTNNIQDGGLDSDTNSHCALILEESTPPVQHQTNTMVPEKNNGNNNYELHEFNRRLPFNHGNSESAATYVSSANSAMTQPLTVTKQFKRT